MSECTRPLEPLLEADPDELRGVGESKTAEHVRSCARCAAAAERVLRHNAALDAALAQSPDAPDVDALLRRARLQIDEPMRGPRDTTPDGARARAWRRWRRWAPVAAAAALAALLLIGDREPELIGTPGAPRTAVAPLVESPDQNVAVIQTDNPDITVLWFY